MLEGGSSPKNNWVAGMIDGPKLGEAVYLMLPRLKQKHVRISLHRNDNSSCCTGNEMANSLQDFECKSSTGKYLRSRFTEAPEIFLVHG